MSPILTTPTVGVPSFPRVSGDEPQVKNNIGAAKVFSPRERG